jgi:N-acetyl-anhydromuramyl-L-alanine amidase AmpD
MTVSKLASGSLAHQKKYSERGGQKVSRVIVHHWAGTSGGDTSLASPGRDASANYVLYSDGTLKSQVPEEFRAWTSGGQAIDAPSITVEVQNSTNAPEWRVSDAAIAKLTELVTDIARRYGWGSVTASRVRGHREFAATACPGPYLFPKLASIAANADRALKAPITPTTAKPSGQEEDEDMNVVGYIRDKAQGSQGSVYALQENGKKRLISKAEWNSLRALEGQGVKLHVAGVSAADLKVIPQA